MKIDTRLLMALTATTGLATACAEGVRDASSSDRGIDAGTNGDSPFLQTNSGTTNGSSNSSSNTDGTGGTSSSTNTSGSSSNSTAGGSDDSMGGMSDGGSDTSGGGDDSEGGEASEGGSSAGTDSGGSSGSNTGGTGNGGEGCEAPAWSNGSSYAKDDVVTVTCSGSPFANTICYPHAGNVVAVQCVAVDLNHCATQNPDGTTADGGIWVLVTTC